MATVSEFANLYRPILYGSYGYQEIPTAEFDSAPLSNWMNNISFNDDSGLKTSDFLTTWTPDYKITLGGGKGGRGDMTIQRANEIQAALKSIYPNATQEQLDNAAYAALVNYSKNNGGDTYHYGMNSNDILRSIGDQMGGLPANVVSYLNSTDAQQIAKGQSNVSNAHSADDAQTMSDFLTAAGLAAAAFGGASLFGSLGSAGAATGAMSIPGTFGPMSSTAALAPSVSALSASPSLLGTVGAAGTIGAGAIGGNMFDSIGNFLSHPLDSLSNLFTSQPTAATGAADGLLGGAALDAGVTAGANAALGAGDVVQVVSNAVKSAMPSLSGSALSSAVNTVLKGGSAGGVNLGTVLGGIAGLTGLGNAKQSGTTTNTSTRVPWEPMQPYLQQIAQKAAEQYSANQQMPSYMQEIGGSYLDNLRQMNSMMPQISNLSNLGMSGYFNPILEDVPNIALPGDPNPYVDDTIKGISSQSNENLLDNVLPEIRSGAVAAGYGGSRQGIAEGNAIAKAQKAINDQAASLKMGAYENYQNRLQNANQFNANLGLQRSNQNMAAAQQALSNQMSAANLGLNASNQYANNLMNGWNMANQYNNYGWNQLNQGANIINSMAGMGGTTSSSQPYYTNPIGNALGLAQLGGNIWGAI